MERRKPKIGLLGLITGGYESIFPGILKRQEAYAGEIAASLEDVAHIVFEKAGTDRATIEGIVEQYNRMELDGMLIVLLAYYPGAYLTRALQKNRLPIAMAVVQPDQEVLDDWEELDFTVNQGIHGAQDNANTIHRLKIACSFFVGNRNEERFRRFVEDFAKACYARAELMGMRVGVFSRMCGMGDILADDMAFYKKIGPEICHDTIGSIVSKMKEVNEREIEELAIGLIRLISTSLRRMEDSGSCRCTRRPDCWRRAMGMRRKAILSARVWWRRPMLSEKTMGTSRKCIPWIL